jgi:PHD/YefM family antitoxin component YafN of YafNO toxin-antitoxin module
MKFLTVSELRQRATQIVAEIESTREEVIITKNGKPVVLMRFVTDEAFSLKETETKKEVKKNGKTNAGTL